VARVADRAAHRARHRRAQPLPASRRARPHRELSGLPLLPIGTLYDPFVTRGLDALYHALYSGARFVVAATPSGVSLAPEGGAHQSVITPASASRCPASRTTSRRSASDVEWILLHGLRRLLDRLRREPLPALSTRRSRQTWRRPRASRCGTRCCAARYRLLDARTAAGYGPSAR
jgi:pyruvate dehydrogenase E1 component